MFVSQLVHGKEAVGSEGFSGSFYCTHSSKRIEGGNTHQCILIDQFNLDTKAQTSIVGEKMQVDLTQENSETKY